MVNFRDLLARRPKEIEDESPAENAIIPTADAVDVDLSDKDNHQDYVANVIDAPTGVSDEKPPNALYNALLDGDVGLSLQLINDGADVNARGPKKRAPLHLAAMNGYKAVAEALLRKGADPDPIDKDYWTPLCLACGHGHTMLVDLFLANGANINYQDDEGWAPLHQASSRHYDIVKLLLEHGADATLQTSDGETALELARQQGDTQLYQLLLDHEQKVSDGDDANLCPACMEISYDSLSLESRVLYHNGKTEIVSGFEHSQSVKQLRESAKTCRLCSYIVASIVHDIKDEREGSPVYLQFEQAEEDPVMPFDGIVFVVVQIVGMDPRQFGTNKLGISAEAGSSAAEHGSISVRPFPSNPVCDANIWAMKSWLGTCKAAHQNCGVTVNSILPKRLLDIDYRSSQYDCCLVETTGLDNVSYCTLSYCWGSRPEQISEKATISGFMYPNGIDTNACPATYRDAVLVARKLGIRYIWIDALCILQDDPNDWQEEALKMGDIYRNAKFTIAATSSVSTADGFLEERKTADRIAVPYNGPGANSRDEVFFLHPRLPSVAACINPTTWNRRGWTLQERLLSRNVIHFTSGPVILECEAGTWTELHSHRSEGWLEADDHHTRAYTQDDKNTLVTSNKRFASAEWDMSLWRTITLEYTRRAFTFPDDKIVALEGIVQTLAANPGYTHYSGLWQSLTLDEKYNQPPGNKSTQDEPHTIPAPEDTKPEDLMPSFEYTPSSVWIESVHSQLLWCATGPLRSKPRDRAPSWSWLTIDVSVGNAANICYPQIWFQNCNARIEFLSTPKGLIKHTHVLQITGKLKKVYRGRRAHLGKNYGGPKPWSDLTGISDEVYDWYYLFDSTGDEAVGHNDGKTSKGTAGFDRDDPSDHGLWVMLLTCGARGFASVWAVILEKMEDDSAVPKPVFKKCGIAQMTKSEFFSDVGIESILVI